MDIPKPNGGTNSRFIFTDQDAGDIEASENIEAGASAPMVTKRDEDIISVLEAMERRNRKGENVRNWLLAGIMIASFIGQGADWLARKGFFLGGPQQEQAAKDHDNLEKLRTLYMIRWGEDPFTTSPDTMKRERERYEQQDTPPVKASKSGNKR